MTSPPSDTRNQEAPFNMAVATLMRLDQILHEIKDLAFSNYTDGQKQKAKVELVKNFYINSIPLLDSFEEYKFLLDVQPAIKEELSTNGKRTGNKKIFFDEALEKKLNVALVNIQLAIRTYFMPARKDKGRAITEF